MAINSSVLSKCASSATTLVLLVVLGLFIKVFVYSRNEVVHLSANALSNQSPVIESHYARMVELLTGESAGAKATWKFVSYLRTPDYHCTKNIRLGDDDDGGWHICNDPPFTIEAPCKVYSFGIKNDWSFDEHISNVQGCEVYSFDPSIHKEDHNRSNLISFYNMGIFGPEVLTKKGWAMGTFHDIVKKLGHTNQTIDMVKMDVEGSEYQAIKNMVRDGDVRYVKQFAVEVHEGITMPKCIEILRLLENNGFRKYHYNRNKYCAKKVDSVTGFKRSSCHEIHYVNTAYLK